LFEVLQTANGVGPKLAQTILAVYSPRDVRRAVSTGDLAALTRVPGIGRKGAERILVDLRDRIGSVDGGPPELAAATTPPPAWREQLRQALAGLGFTGKEAGEAIEVVAADLEDGAQPDLATLLRRSIQLLGRTR
jgi:Holliday junction DNA helicase RuvA